MMTIAALHRSLEKAMQKGLFGRDAEAKAAFALLAAVLSDYPDLAVDEFCRKARDGLKKISKVKKTAAPSIKPEKAAKTSAVSEPVIGRYLGELEQTRADSRQFETVVERMKKDKTVRPAEAREIAKRFTGGSHTYKSKPDAAKAILRRQIMDVRAAGKAGHIGDIF